MVHALTLCGALLSLATPCLAYKITTLDAVEVCNQTIYLDDGPKSAAILTLTSKNSYDFAPMHCFIHFIAPMHKWSGLTGVLEEIDLRRYEDSSRHRLPDSECVDYILVGAQTDLPQGRQCGTWSVGGQDELSHLGYQRALVGYCPSPPAAPGSGMQRCGVSKIQVEVSIGERDSFHLWRDVKWRPHRGFTLVVTAYMYSFTMEGLVPVMVGPWVGAALLLLLMLAGVVYWRRARPPPPRDPRPPQELNSYAESYEVSSTLSSAHHMAIQVRVVCNSGHGMGGSGATHLTSTTQLPPPHSLHRWPGPSGSTMDLPPSYDSLFPHGPPSPRGCMAATPATPASAASLDITATTTSMLSLGSSTGAVSPGHGHPPAAATATQTSNIVIPLNAICSATHTPTLTTASTTVTTAPSANHINANANNPSASTTSSLPQASSSSSYAPVNTPSVEFTPLAQPEDSAISLSSLCGDPSPDP
ncbi:hypothetical protein GWK47_022294 [Chionoecetes opilio]|uniref:Uncharacterized protein n=1 Tax=Chionoecetes opilio TaxID=41210 RepID=A0A8J5CK85_CHIOP|nr:hypothetical protein GWK47_022294 [Chionoecetes opilio]